MLRFEQLELRVFDFFVVLVIADVALDHFCGHFVAYRACKITVFPKLTTPQLTLDLRMLLENRARTQALQPRYDLRDRQLGREGTENVNMILAHFQLFDFNAVGQANFQQQSVHPFTHRTPKNLFAIFGRPHQMIRCVIHAVRTTSKSHLFIVAITLPPSGYAAALIPPRRKQRGILSVFREKAQSCIGHRHRENVREAVNRHFFRCAKYLGVCPKAPNRDPPPFARK